MYLHKILIDKETLIKDRKKWQDAYSVHQKIWALASQDQKQKRNFLYRVEYDSYQNIKGIYLLAPYQITSQNGAKVTISPRYQPDIETNECLYFKLTANPIIKRKENGKAKEYSLIMDAKQRFKIDKKDYLEQYSLDELIYDVGMKWLTRKGEQHGFAVKRFEVTINNDREYKIKPIGRQEYILRTLDFSGTLTVTKPSLFLKSIYEGIGSAKGFGCGLMLVRRV
jgi:CRISPR system Cascade subunit CasE